MQPDIVYSNGVTYNTNGSFGIDIIADLYGPKLHIRDFIHGVPHVPILITINGMTPDRLRDLGNALLAAAGE